MNEFAESPPETNSPNDNTPPEVPSDDRFHIRPIIAWCGAALGLAAGVAMELESLGEISLTSITAVSFLILHTAYGVMAGLGLALLLDSIRQEKFSRLLPGHWRLITTACYFVALWADLLIDRQPIVLSDRSPMITTSTYVICGYYGLMGLFFLAVVLTTKETKLWQSFAYVSLVGAGAMLVLQPLLAIPDFPKPILLVLGIGGMLLVTVAFVLAICGVVFDLIQKRPRDLLHWVGIVVPYLLPLLLATAVTLHNAYF